MQNNSPTVIGPLRLCAYMLWTVLRNWRLVLLVKRFRLHDCRQYLSAWQEASQVSLWNRRRVLLRLQFQDWRSSRAVVHATDVFQPTQDALSESRPPFSAPSPFDAVGPCESVDLSGALFPGMSSPTEPQQSVIPPTVVPSRRRRKFIALRGGGQSRPWGAHLIQQRLRGPVITGYRWGLPRLARP